MNKLVHQGSQFELWAKLNREPMEFPEYRSYPSIFTRICNNSGCTILDRLWSVKIKFGETPKKWVTVVQPTANKSIGNWHSCIMSQELPNISKIPQLNKAAFTNILDVFFTDQEGRKCVLQNSRLLWFLSLPCRPGFVVGSGVCGWAEYCAFAC